MFVIFIVCGCSSGDSASPPLKNNTNTTTGTSSIVWTRDWATGSLIYSGIQGAKINQNGDMRQMSHVPFCFETTGNHTNPPEIIFQTDVSGLNGPSELRSSKRNVVFPVQDRGYMSGPEGAKYPFKSGRKVSFTFLSGTLPVSYQTYACFFNIENPADYHVLPASVPDARTTAINENYIVFSEYTQGIWIYTTDCVLVKQVKTHTRPSSWCPVISSNNDIVAFSSCAMSGATDIYKQREIYVYDISLALLKRITLDPDAAMVEPSLTADGSKIAFLRSPEVDGQYNNIQIAMINSDGTGYQIIDPNGYNQTVRISALGDAIAWAHNNDIMTIHGYSIRTWQSGTIRDLTTNDKQNIYVDIDDSGRFVTYAKEEGYWSDFQIHLINVVGNVDDLVCDSQYWDVYPVF